ncbi:hypothetical protein MJO28_007455 [Puccinia striiformis f. sp. tritici]|uniref:Uncharacterized protein n=1 Tax=Puccinia striiformis f. sp. tritici TaxID=168172 RepID=A0ACC0EEL9_9BASI|nr:hypothetical protein Pst134EB_014554 [Puccinia striiformis f. sp. tritici]KAI7951771.1 hypothetical protein MJO28_007455 [Puccinia striiformis f. sp. tritici]
MVDGIYPHLAEFLLVSLASASSSRVRTQSRRPGETPPGWQVYHLVNQEELLPAGRVHNLANWEELLSVGEYTTSSTRRSFVLLVDKYTTSSTRRSFVLLVDKYTTSSTRLRPPGQRVHNFVNEEESLPVDE